MREFNVQVLADYHQVLLYDSAADWSTLSDRWTPEATSAMLVVGPGLVAIGTARDLVVPVSFRVLDGPPSGVTEGADRVNDASLDVPSGILCISGVSDHESEAHRIELPPATYRARISYFGLKSISADGMTGLDRYLIEIWS